MSTTDYASLTQEFYTLLLSDFKTAVDRFLADDFVWENPLPDLIPFGGSYDGAAGMLKYLGQINDAIEMTPLQFTDLVCQEGVVAAIGIEEKTLVKSTGKYYSMPFVHVVRFNGDDRITHVREYNDTRDMVAAFQG